MGRFEIITQVFYRVSPFECYPNGTTIQDVRRGLLRFAVFSDIHNNIEAFNTVLADIRKQNVEKCFCLGDLLGYGPKPVECVDLMMKLCEEGVVEVCLLGNHDQATLYDPEGFNQIAEVAIFWTREVLESARGARASARWEFISERPRTHRFMDSFLFVHGSPQSPISEYVFEEDIDDKSKMSKLFSRTPQYCFMGHTHVPGIFVDRSSQSDYRYLSYKDILEKFGGRFPLGEQKLMINVGSVGQPRDKNPDSCYVVVQFEENGSDNFVEYRRIPYDISKTQTEIKSVPKLASFPFLWQRLASGR